ncbi:unnamed protein product [Didymodactylos carnosus]|uniref:Uncharacterized protein n=1 Tax=Didymodactylos carnosus TaxID=1234261 RepID=A0A8S2Y3K1_9BILA|nr:unnamed protein product [Didymodactylos carnosus]
MSKTPTSPQSPQTCLPPPLTFVCNWNRSNFYMCFRMILSPNEMCERLELALVYFGIRFCESRGDDQDEANTAVKHNNYEDAKALTLAHSRIAASILDRKIQNLMDKPAVVCVT